MRKGLIASAAAIALMAPGLASAVPVSITGIVATWSNADPAANVTYVNNNSAAPTANWGTGGLPSGYDFVAAGVPINADVPPASPNFSIGTFTHRNNPITSGTSIQSIQLTVAADISINGGAAQTKLFIFDFTHDETDNAANPCAYGGANNQGVNANGCADSVTVTFNNLSESIDINGETFVLNIVGFQVGSDFVDNFLTKEGANNPAQLIANFDYRSNVVPVPMSLALFGVGLAGLGIAVRRRAA